MAIPFDTLGYAKALKSAGIEANAAEAHAEAARDYIMKDLVTKPDLDAAIMRVIIAMGGMVGLAVGVILAAIPLLTA